MIRLALFTVTVAAALFAFLAIAPAQQIRYIIPPAEYDRPYEGDLSILTYDSTERIKLACNMPSSLPSLACAFPGKGSCWIIIAALRHNGGRTRGALVLPDCAQTLCGRIRDGRLPASRRPDHDPLTPL